MAAKKSLELFKEIGKMLHQKPGFHHCLEHVRVTGGGPGHCLAEFVVRPDDLNADGGLNGGLTATIVSNFTTYALLASGSKPGTTADLHVSYLKGAHEGDTVIVDAKTLKAGRNIAYLECELRNKANGQVIAKGSHTKFLPRMVPTT